MSDLEARAKAVAGYGECRCAGLDPQDTGPCTFCRALAALREVAQECAGIEFPWPTDCWVGDCHDCGNREREGHKPTCGADAAKMIRERFGLDA